MKTTIFHSKIGEITLYVRRGLSRTTFTVSENGVRISTLPQEVTTLFPLSEERVEWILSAKQRIEKNKKKHIVFDKNTILKTNKFTVVFKKNNLIKTSFTAIYKDNILEINYLPEVDFTKKQNVIKNIISHYLKQEAQTYLPQRLSNLAEKYGFEFQSVKINSAKKRWGSCSARRNINLSLFLMLLPEELIDFVLVHELCHTREMNHGKNFKMLMKSIFPNYENLNTKLKNERTL